MLSSLGRRARSLVLRLIGSANARAWDARVNEEIRFHLDMQAERNRRLGLSDDEARRAALVSFGGREPWKEAARDEYRSRPLEDVVADVRYAARTLTSSPGFTLAAVLTLAIGIGANTAIFSAVDGVLLKPLPFSDPDRIVRVFQYEKKQGDDRAGVAPGNFAAWRDGTRTLAAIAAAEPFGYVYSGTQGKEAIRAWNVTRDFFTVLDAKPARGRVFEASDFVPGSSGVVVITYASWRTRFGGDPSIVGRKMTLNNVPATIIGVLPQDFSYRSLRSPQEVYVPKVLDTNEVRLRGPGWYVVVARLRAGATVAEANADVNAVAARVAREFPRSNANVGAAVVPLRTGIVGGSTRPLYLLLGAVGCLLLIACTNVANLMLARMNRRSPEFAVRVAIGAARGRIVRQLLTESFLIALIGGSAGALLARWGCSAIKALSPPSLPRVDEIGVDFRALAFTLIAVVLTTFGFGLLPAMRAAAFAQRDALASPARSIGGRAQHRARDVLVAVEVAVAVLLLVGAGLLIRSFASIVDQDRGYRSDHLLAAAMFFWDQQPTWGRRAAFTRELVGRASHLPGVTSAGAVSALPMSGAIGVEEAQYTVVGEAEPSGQNQMTRVTALTPGAFGALGMSLAKGRLFTSSDDSSSMAVAVISQSMATRHWPRGDAIGKRIRIGFYGNPIEREIVGVVGDVRQESLDVMPQPTVYLPHAQAATGTIFLVVRTARDPGALRGDVKRLLADLDPSVPVASMATADDYVSDSLKPRRFTLLLFACFSIAALVLAVIGVYGVVRQSTAERSRELGVRIALGAQSSDVIQMVMRQGLAAAVVGVLVGALAAATVSRLLASMLYAVSPLDVPTYAVVIALMLLTATVASFIPARRATRTNPLVALRGP